MALAILAGIVKVILGLFVPLSADEAYYWVWSKHLDFGYFDHPPMTAWMLALGKPFEHFASGVRIPAILIGHLTLFIWALILKDLLPERRRLLWLGLFLACPLTGLGGVVITPDLPLMLFWSLSILFLKKIVDRGAATDFIGFGVCLGLGFVSKYQIVLLPLSLLPLVFYRDLRKSILRPGLFLTFLSGLLACAPVLGWNAQHEWESFRFQLQHGFEGKIFSWHWPGDYALGEFILLFPTVLWAMKRAPIKENPFWRVLIATGVVPLAFFFLASFKAAAELNWPAMGFPGLFAVAALAITMREFWIDVLFWIAIELLLIASLVFPMGLRLADQLTEPTKYKILRELPKTHAPLFASTYQMASSLWYSSGVPVYKLRGMSRPDMFDRWPGSLPPKGTFYVLREEDTEQYLPKESSPEKWISRRIDSPSPGLELLEVTRP